MLKRGDENLSFSEIEAYGKIRGIPFLHSEVKILFDIEQQFLSVKREFNNKT